MRTSAACYTTHETACGRFRYLWFTLPPALLETAGLWLALRGPAALVLPAWRFAHVFAFMALNTLLVYVLILADMALRKDR